MVGQPEQHLAGLEGLAIDRVAIGDDAVLRGGPDDGVGYAPGFLDLLDDLGSGLAGSPAGGGRRRHGRADRAAPDGAVASSRSGPFQPVTSSTMICTPALSSSCPNTDISGSPLRTWVPLVTGITLLMKPSKRMATTESFVSSKAMTPGALMVCEIGCLPTSSVFTPLRCNLPGRDLDGVAVVLVALVDGDVVHPHRILLRHQRDVGKAHRVAVMDDLLAGLRLRRGLGVDAHVFAGEDGHVCFAVVGLPRRQRIERPAVGVLVIDDGAGGLRHTGHR